MCNKYHGSWLSRLTLRKTQQERVWRETQDLSLQMLKVHMCGELCVLHNCELLISGMTQREREIQLADENQNFGLHL